MDDTTTTPTILLLCRLNLRHHWRRESTDGGQLQMRCSRCVKDNPRLGTGGGPLTIG